jgi:hypothetical protein
MPTTQYRLYTGESNVAQREIHQITIEQGANWKPILMSSTTMTPGGIFVSVIFENVIYAANERRPEHTPK